jgi:uncharacterized protein (DUF4415 family)
MSAKLRNTPKEWVDPDDAPELTDEFFEKATPMIGERAVSKEEFLGAARHAMRMGRPKTENPKRALTVRYDADIIDAFKASGAGWQTRMNDALRDWLKSHEMG